MNEQQMEAVERLVESGIFPKGLIAITPRPKGESVNVYYFLSRKPPVKRPLLFDFYQDILGIGEDDGDEWKRAGVL